jgi:CRISPR-associated protein Cmr1
MSHFGNAPNNPWMLLADVAKEMQLYRSNGRVNPRTGNREVNGIPLVPPLRFWPDHNIALAIALNTVQPNHPERTVFGLPHNYFFSGRNAQVRMEPNVEGRTRRASPLLIHFHEFSNGSACAVQSLFPAIFLAATDMIAMKWNRGNTWPTVSTVPPAVNWSVITDYLDRFPYPPRVTVL